MRSPSVASRRTGASSPVRITALLCALSIVALGVGVSAQPARDSRDAWLARVVATVRTLPHTEADAARMCEGPLPSGVTCTALPRGGYPCMQSGQRAMCPSYGFTYTFDPPMPAASVVRTMGWRNTRIISTDVHMRHWVIAETAGAGEGRRSSQSSVLGVWRVEASVDRPSGRPTGDFAGPSAVYGVGSRTPVLRLSFGLDTLHDHPGIPPRAW